MISKLAIERWRTIVKLTNVGTRLNPATTLFCRETCKGLPRFAKLSQEQNTWFVVHESTVGGRRIKGIHMVAGNRRILVSISALEQKTVSNKAKALSAMRDMVADQLAAYRAIRQASLGVDFSCPLSGKDLRKVKTHVDHYSVSFKKLVEDWCRLNSVDLKTVKLSGRTQKKFKDEKLTISWQAYHRLHADLRLVEAKANCSKGAKTVFEYKVGKKL